MKDFAFSTNPGLPFMQIDKISKICIKENGFNYI